MLGRCLSAMVALIAPLMMATGGLLLAPPAPALAVETAGTVYVIDRTCCSNGHGGVIKVDTTKSNTPPGSNQTIVSQGQNFVSPTGATLDPVHDVLYVADATCCGGHGGVIKIDLSQDEDSNQAVVASGHDIRDPVGIVLDQDGNLDVLDAACCTGNHGGVIKVNPNGTNDEAIRASSRRVTNLPFPWVSHWTRMARCTSPTRPAARAITAA